jgi:hypothetical protein
MISLAERIIPPTRLVSTFNPNGPSYQPPVTCVNSGVIA